MKLTLTKPNFTRFGIIFLFATLIGIFHGRAVSQALTFKDDVNGFEITALPNWDKESTKSYVLLLKRKSERGMDGIAAYSVTVGISPGPLSDFSKLLKNQPKRYEEQSRTRFPDAQFISATETVIGGFPALKVITRYTQANLDVRIPIEGIQYFVVRGNRSYMIQIEAKSPTSNSILEEVRAMQSSFSFR